MPERVPERFGGDPVDFVTQNRMEISRVALNCTRNPGRWLVESVAEFFTQVLMASARSLLCDRGIAQSLHGVPTFGDRLGDLIDGAFQLFLRFHRALRH